jgi:hypothetical protein
MSQSVTDATVVLQPGLQAKMSFRHSALSLLRSVALSAIVLPGAALRAESEIAPDVHAARDGVSLDAYARDGRIVFCFNAEKDVKIASEYGVEFTVPKRQARFWNESLPKVVAGTQPYFDLPVRIELKTRGASQERQVSTELGICVAAKYCTPITFEITVPATGASNERPPCDGK